MKLENGVTIVLFGKQFINEVPDKYLVSKGSKEIIELIEKTNKQQREKVAKINLEKEIKENEDDLDEYEDDLDEYEDDLEKENN